MTQQKRTGLFLGVLLFAGVCNMFTRTKIPFLNTLMFCLNFLLCAGLLLYWMQSVRARLLPTKARGYIVAAVVLMLGYLILRIFKYRIVTDAVIPARYAVYAYWMPQLLIPALFCMTCIRVRRGDQERGDEALLLIPACLLALLVLTNDLYRLVYRPAVELTRFRVATGSYSLGPGFYLLYVWMVLASACGIILLLREAGRRVVRAVFSLLDMILLWLVLVLLCILVFERRNLPCPFHVPEIHIFCMLGFIELCIRNRLIPSNENYAGFFSLLDLPVLITDRALTPVYASSLPVEATREQLTASLSAPVALNGDKRLSGMELRAGYAFWVEDESALHRERRRLAEAAELLSEENDLIAVENRLKEKQAQLEAQNRVYDRIAAALYPTQARVEALLAAAAPGTEDFQSALALCCVLNAYSKRKSNLLLLSEETLPKRNRELFLALQESASALKYCGVKAAAVGGEYSALPLSAVHALYDAFEAVLETWLPHMKRMTVSLTDDGLRLATETEGEPPLPETVLPVERRWDEGYSFLHIRARTGDGAV